MTENLSLLQKFDDSCIHLEPFPHILIENALPKDVYTKLNETIPNSLIKDLNLDNKRGDIYKEDLENNSSFKLWYDFLNYHSSSEFLNESISCFKDQFNEKELKKIQLNIKNFTKEELKNSPLSQSAAYSFNSPVQKPSPPRGAHLDARNKMFFGLFYLRNPEDDSLGGNLILYKWKDGINDYEKRKIFYFSKYSSIDLKYLEEYKTIKYSQNTLVLGLNTLNSIHGVSVRQKTKFIRQFCYISSQQNLDFLDIRSTLREKITYNVSLFQKLKIIILEILLKLGLKKK